MLALLQEQKKKELEELNAMLAELGVAPKEADGQGAETAPTAGKKKKKKDKSAAKDGDTAASKDGEPATANGNGVAPVPLSKPTEEEQNQPPEPAIEVSRRHMSQVWAPILALRRHSWSANLCT